jgi:transcription initiation factor IIE alpha subunit
MQLELLGRLIGMFVDRILDDVFPEETGAARLQQIGLFTLIFVLEQRGETVTTARLAELTGQSPSAVYKQLDKLDRSDVIARKKETHKHRRGFTYVLSIKYNDKTKRLIEALDIPSGTKTSAGRGRRSKSK